MNCACQRCWRDRWRWLGNMGLAPSASEGKTWRYAHWLEHALDDTRKWFARGERLVFVNAWNEYAWTSNVLY